MSRRRTAAVLRACPYRRLLVVCYGNIYRSAHASELLRNRLKGISEVRSAGWHPVAGRRSPANVVALSASLGIDLMVHRSSVISRGDVGWADVVILMDRHNWQGLNSLMVDHRKMIWLGALDGGHEITDPYSMAEEDARQVIYRVHRCTESLASRILMRHNSSSSQPLT
jgi:protein-tyrosine-phosphatase